MNKLKYIELQVKFAIQLKIFFKQETLNFGEKNYFYYINKENYNSLKELLNILNDSEIEFLIIYFNNEMNLDNKLLKLGIEKKRRYYYIYNKIIKKVSKEVIRNGIL